MRFNKVTEVLLRLDGKERNKKIVDCLASGELPHSKKLYVCIWVGSNEYCVMCKNHLHNIPKKSSWGWVLYEE